MTDLFYTVMCQYLVLFMVLAMLGDDVFDDKRQFWLHIIPFYWVLALVKLVIKNYKNLL